MPVDEQRAVREAGRRAVVWQKGGGCVEEAEAVARCDRRHVGEEVADVEAGAEPTGAEGAACFAEWEVMSSAAAAAAAAAAAGKP